MYKKSLNSKPKIQNSPAGASLQLVPNSKFKIPQTLSEPSAKESRRAGAAEYVTKDERRMSEGSAKNKSLCGSHRRITQVPIGSAIGYR